MSGLHLRHWPGDADRPALALHCMMGSGATWGPVAQALGGRIDLSGFDMPGHGRSDDWMPGPGDPDYFTAVTRLAAALIERPLDLIGHSFGAVVALRIAVAAPEAIRSLTLIEPVLFAAHPDPDQQARDARMAALLERGDAAQAATEFLSVWGQGPAPDAPSPRLIRQVALVAETGAALHEDSGRLLRPDGLEAIDAPVLLIQGGDSPPVVGGIIDALAARLPDVGRATIPGAGHMAPLTHPAQVAGLIGVNLDRA